MSKIVACVGGGQLAQMLGQAGKDLDIEVRSSSSIGSCAFSDCEAFTENLEEESNFKAFIEGVDVFTFESEHEGLDWVDRLYQNGIEIHPNPEFVKIAGDRFLEKSHLASLEIPTAPFELISDSISKQALIDYLGNLLETQKLSPSGVVVKTRHGGYDGKGQWVITKNYENELINIADEIFNSIVNPGCIVEGLVDFSIECSIIAARGKNGQFVTWPLSHNEHSDSILRFSYSPITVADDLKALENQAKEIAQTLCDSKSYVGTIAVECFVTSNGLIVNEIAPRVHNSGHWTIEGSETSQFEQHLRAITGMELGSTKCPAFAAMVNLVGVNVDQFDFEGLENVYLHWYGKEVKPNRKVGHITILGDTKEVLNQRLETVKDLLNK